MTAAVVLFPIGSFRLLSADWMVKLIFGFVEMFD